MELPCEEALLLNVSAFEVWEASLGARQIRLLLVEDRANTARALAGRLRAAGFAVVAAADAAVAIIVRD